MKQLLKTKYGVKAPISIFIFSMALACSSLAFAIEGNKGYLVDSSGDVAMDSDGDCWRTGSWTPDMAIPECEGDADGDGVVDDKDECPNTPEGAAVDEVGCELDSDGDGVVDSRDRCPGTPPGTEVDADGCEIIGDSDGDGVLDNRDKCPGTPAGVRVDADGCRILTQGDVIKLEGVFFEFDSAKLKSESQTRLDRDAASLNRNAGVRVEIAGHTDSVGSDTYNQSLSQKRAESVREYLLSQGVSSSQLTARGYGESNPVASNTTDDGRAQNRRVEMNVLGQ